MKISQRQQLHMHEEGDVYELSQQCVGKVKVERDPRRRAGASRRGPRARGR